MLCRRSFLRLLLCGCVLLPVATSTAEAGPIRKVTVDRSAETVELFEGIEQGRFAVRVVARDAFGGDVFISNTTDKPLTVVLPPAVAAVHVLKQFGPGIGLPFGNEQPGANGLGNNMMPGQGQSLGGSLGMQGMQPGANPFGAGPGGQGVNGFPGNNFFSIPPAKTVQVKLHSVCLNHGAPDPVPAMTYQLRKLEDVVSDPALRVLLTEYNPRTTDRMAMQAAAWHLANERSWEQLAAQTQGVGGVRWPYFTRKHLKVASQLVDQARQTAEQNQSTPQQTASAR